MSSLPHTANRLISLVARTCRIQISTPNGKQRPNTVANCRTETWKAAGETRSCIHVHVPCMYMYHIHIRYKNEIAIGLQGFRVPKKFATVYVSPLSRGRSSPPSPRSHEEQLQQGPIMIMIVRSGLIRADYPNLAPGPPLDVYSTKLPNDPHPHPLRQVPQPPSRSLVTTCLPTALAMVKPTRSCVQYQTCCSCAKEALLTRRCRRLGPDYTGVDVQRTHASKKVQIRLQTATSDYSGIFRGQRRPPRSNSKVALPMQRIRSESLFNFVSCLLFVYSRHSQFLFMFAAVTIFAYVRGIRIHIDIAGSSYSSI
jgi:hypothetical protein